MTNRPQPPFPEEVLNHRLISGLSMEEAAHLLHVIPPSYRRWESDTKESKRTMHPAIWELFKLKTSEDWKGFLIPLEKRVPTPELIKSTREGAGLSMAAAANILHTGRVTFFQWESPESDVKNHRKMSMGFWELLLFKLNKL